MIFYFTLIHTLTVSVSGISVKMRSRLLSSLMDRLLKSWLALLMMGMAASGKHAALDRAAQTRLLRQKKSDCTRFNFSVSGRKQRSILYPTLHQLTLKLAHEKSLPATAQVYWRQAEHKKWMCSSVFLVSEPLITRSFFLSDMQPTGLSFNQQRKSTERRRTRSVRTPVVTFECRSVLTLPLEVHSRLS